MNTLKSWLSGTDYSILCGTDEIAVNDVIFDSRKAVPDTVYVCIKGSRTDSHKFIGDVIDKGCRTLVVEKELCELGLKSTEDLNIIKTDNARRTLAFLSTARFGHPADEMKLIGITGTKGKTSTSYMLAQVLKEAGFRPGIIGTNGCVIGDEHFRTLNTTPDSYELNSYFRKMADSGCTHVIMECSSQGFKMNRTDGLNFEYGIFLNLSPDHIGPLEHADFEEYMACKLRLFESTKTAIINADDEHAGACGEAARKNCRRVLYTSVDNIINIKPDIQAYNLRYLVDAGFTGTQFDIRGMASGSLRLSIPGAFNVSNAMPVVACCLDMGIGLAVISKALESVHVEGRMEAVYKSDRLTVIVDYAHNSISMETLLSTLRDYEHTRLVVVFGCGGGRSKDRRIGMGRSAARFADFTILTSDNSRNERPEDIIADIEQAFLDAGGSKTAYIKIPDRSEAIRYAMAHSMDGDIVAVIGKGHEDYQEENGVKRHFSDKEEILRIKDELGL